MKRYILPNDTAWCWPINLDTYDRNPMLSEAERDALAKLSIVHHPKYPTPIRWGIRTTLQRLLRPIDDALAFVHTERQTHLCAVRTICLEMHRRGRAFWNWSIEEWHESIGQTQGAYAERYGWGEVNRKGRHQMAVIVYLLCSHLPFDSFFQFIQPTTLARKIFSDTLIQAIVERLWAVLQGWGYQQKNRKDFILTVCCLLLQKRHPSLEDLSSEFLELMARTSSVFAVQRQLFQVSRALAALGLIEKPLLGSAFKRPSVSGTDGSVSPEWLSWCQRWRRQCPLQQTHSIYYPLLQVGRWLNREHPEVTNPNQWTYDLAAEFVALVMNMKVGEWVDARQLLRLSPDRIGQPLRPRAKEKVLKAMRVFLCDCQEWEWIPRSLNPIRAIPIPRSLRSLIGPDPRVISKDLWAKLLWAAMNLQAEDLPLAGNIAPIYPLEMVRAVAVVWCFAALRSDEIQRLRVGCIRWQYEDVMIPETGEMLPRDAICFLDIPVNKTMTAYTKAVHTIVGKRINEWEQTRPHEQLRALDKKTSETVQFLFSYRGQLVSKVYITTSLIPTLCRKAGIPEQDSRGHITSHRARATIASQLYNAREPLTIFELKEYLGHKYLSSTQHYTQVDPTKLASKVAKAGYLEQNQATIEVLLDQEAVMSGRASHGGDWKYYDLGHGFCANPFWASCAHRMACAKCPFYRPKTETMEQLIEGKANLIHMLEFVSLTEDEKLLVTEGIELHQELIEKLVDVPTPAGPTPRELEQSRQPETKVIPLKAVRRSKR